MNGMLRLPVREIITYNQPRRPPHMQVRRDAATRGRLRN